MKFLSPRRGSLEQFTLIRSMAVSAMCITGVSPVFAGRHGRDGRATHGQDARATFDRELL